MPDNEIMRDIILREWEMFQKTQNKGGRASCQDDFSTFLGMRWGQFASWSEEAAESYLGDLKAAEAQGRNLVAEKYLWMMQSTYPAEFEAQKGLLPPMTGTQKDLADAICAEMVRQTEPLRERYPLIGGAGRPLYASEDGVYGTSIETYQRGELYTYSPATLEALKKHLDDLKSRGVSLAELILRNSMKHYGYEDLDEAEKALGALSGAGDAK